MTVITQASKERSCRQLRCRIEESKKPIAITITGAVTRPGVHLVAPGTSLKELLDKAPLSRDAERKKVPFKKVFYAPQTVNIPQKKEEFRREQKISLLRNLDFCYSLTS